MNNDYLDYLQHHGVKGMKWGHRKKIADNYSDAQRKADRRMYSRGAERRINRKMLNGEHISGARSREADRINSYRKASDVAGATGKTLGTIAGVVGGGILGKRIGDSRSRVNRYLRSKLGNEATNALSVVAPEALAIGGAAIGAALGKHGASSVTMVVGGYAPSKKRT